MTRDWRRVGWISAALTGCGGNHSVFAPAADAAAHIASLGWLLLASCAAVYLATLVVFLWALRRARHRAATAAPEAAPSAAAERRLARPVAAAVGLTILILTGFVAASYSTDRALLPAGPPALQVELIAHQWWWEIRYSDSGGVLGFVTANELHLPVGEPVAIQLQSDDVIHSFWIPALGGKRDILPGRSQEIRVDAARAGTWRGRCAEYCGLEHAHMELTAVAEPRAAFDAWRRAQAAPAAQPQTDEQRRGEQVFVQAACVMCHGIRGSAAAGYGGTAPDLTHLKSRATLAAGTLPNTKGYLGGWIADPQTLKPGARMPVVALEPADYQALLAYLEILH